MKRVVCDTNIYISAFIFPGSKPDQVLNLARQGLIELYVSPFIIDELRRVLEEKFRLGDTKIMEVTERVRELSTIVEPEVRVSIIQEKQDDNRILEGAIQARAHYLVTGDTKHILPLREYQGISICSPADFLQGKLWLEES